jgi:hypothetical protein
MTADEIKSRFPRASAAFIKANLSAGDPGQVAKLERNPGNEPLEAQKGEGQDHPMFLVSIACRRIRPLDKSNRCYKFHEDLLRYAGVIPDDTSEEVDSESPQFKCAKGEPEEIIVEVWEVSDPARETP